jgi:hypothetical protein
LVAQQHAFEVRVPIVLAGLMMRIIETRGRELFDPFQDVAPQA